MSLEKCPKCGKRTLDCDIILKKSNCLSLGCGYESNGKDVDWDAYCDERNVTTIRSAIH